MEIVKFLKILLIIASGMTLEMKMDIVKINIVNIFQIPRPVKMVILEQRIVNLILPEPDHVNITLPQTLQKNVAR